MCHKETRRESETKMKVLDAMEQIYRQYLPAAASDRTTTEQNGKEEKVVFIRREIIYREE